MILLSRMVDSQSVSSIDSCRRSERLALYFLSDVLAVEHCPLQQLLEYVLCVEDFFLVFHCVRCPLSLAIS